MEIIRDFVFHSQLLKHVPTLGGTLWNIKLVRKNVINLIKVCVCKSFAKKDVWQSLQTGILVKVFIPKFAAINFCSIDREKLKHLKFLNHNFLPGNKKKTIVKIILCFSPSPQKSFACLTLVSQWSVAVSSLEASQRWFTVVFQHTTEKDLCKSVCLCAEISLGISDNI